MAKLWILDTETKGTGAHVAPLDGTPREAGRPARARRSRARREREPERTEAAPKRQSRRSPQGQRRSGPLPAGHVRKKATGEIGRLRSVDARAGTATVLWLREGRLSSVPLAAISRR